MVGFKPVIRSGQRRAFAGPLVVTIQHEQTGSDARGNPVRLRWKPRKSMLRGWGDDAALEEDSGGKFKLDWNKAIDLASDVFDSLDNGGSSSSSSSSPSPGSTTSSWFSQGKVWRKDPETGQTQYFDPSSKQWITAQGSIYDTPSVPVTPVEETDYTVPLVLGALAAIGAGAYFLLGKK